VTVLKNGAEVGTATDCAYGYGAKGGGIGVAFGGSVGAQVDDFGGGDTAPCP
jgi:hypothetical protein